MGFKYARQIRTAVRNPPVDASVVRANMAVEEVRVRLRSKLEASYGAEEALAALEHKLVATMEAGFRKQTWQLVKVVIAAQGVVVAAIAGIGAALRFA